jgi:transcriptional regulator of acetoin/glycerol metabolism
LVTKATLLDSVWPQVTVSDSTPGICVAELRKALGDDRTAPRFIETVHGRGYRFIAPVTTTTASDLAFKMPSVRRPMPAMVGREIELEQLQGQLAAVLEGQRRIVFVTGEPGIGKTTFVRAFLDSIAQRALRIGCGQCIEQYREDEPYMPVLEALTSSLSGDAQRACA